MVRRLAAVGSRSINNLVDITNYVMHEFGQPMHAYDAQAVKDNKFFIRRGKQNEKYITLDGKERTLTPEMLIISDTEKVIGMPIMGGANSEINEKTQNIALEGARFLPAIVRRAGRLLGLSSESAIRFERGVDAASTKEASDFATYLISKILRCRYSSKNWRLYISRKNRISKNRNRAKIEGSQTPLKSRLVCSRSKRLITSFRIQKCRDQEQK